MLFYVAMFRHLLKNKLEIMKSNKLKDFHYQIINDLAD